MKICANVPQHLADGTANSEWLSLRAGKFTGSDFYQYMGILKEKIDKETKEKKADLSDTAESNLYKKVLESMGEVFDSPRSEAMERGNELEPIARAEYMGDTFNDVQEVAFVDWEKLRAGCSPDGVIYGQNKEIEKIIEIKCPEIKNYLKMAKGKIPKLYECQMQYNMLITGAKSCDFVVYYPDMRLIVQEINADAEYQAEIVKALELLNARYDEILEEIKELKR